MRSGMGTHDDPSLPRGEGISGSCSDEHDAAPAREGRPSRVEGLLRRTGAGPSQSARQ